jgi:hypothetical protein
MAVPQDYAACQRKWPIWRDRLEMSVQSVVNLSPDSKQAGILRSMFPSADIMEKTIGNWDLNEPATFSCGLVVACNVFHYSPNPTLWFQNVFKVCHWFWMQDLCLRDRGGCNGRGLDGDQVRYAYGGLPSSSKFDLCALKDIKDRITDIHFYDAGSKESGKLCLNFVACFRGDL